MAKRLRILLASAFLVPFIPVAILSLLSAAISRSTKWAVDAALRLADRIAGVDPAP